MRERTFFRAELDAEASGEQVPCKSGPVGGHTVEEGEQIGHAHHVDAARVRVRPERESPQHRVAAVAVADDGDLVRGRDALLHRPFGGVDNIVRHSPTELAETGLEEALAEAEGAAVVALW